MNLMGQTSAIKRTNDNDTRINSDIRKTVLPGGSPDSLALARRDWRIDFFRGAALLVVLIDHLELNSEAGVISKWTLISLGFSDSAEVFVFLSGYAFGFSYLSKMANKGLRACEGMALRRSLQIYAAYLASIWAVLALSTVLSETDKVAFHLRIGASFWQEVVSTLVLSRHPEGYSILALYIVILPFMPPALQLALKHPWMAFCISAGTYAAAQFVLPLDPSSYVQIFREWHFNPFAWQFLFMIGMLCAQYFDVGENRRYNRFMLVISSAIIVTGVLVVKVFPMLNEIGIEPLAPLVQQTWSELPTLHKSRLGPLRLLHALSLLYVASQVFRASNPFWSSLWAKPFVILGQHSLPTYAFGLVLSTIGAILRPLHDTALTMGILLLDVDLCLLSFCFALVLHLGARPRGGRQNVEAS